MVNAVIIAQAAVILIILTAIILLISDASGSREQKMMSFFLCGILVQNTGYLLEFLSASMETALMCVKIQYLGSIFVPLCYCWFLYSYCYEKPPKKLICLLVLIDIATLGMVLTLDFHDFYYKSTEWLVTDGGHHYLSLKYGPGYFVFIVFGCVIPYSLSVLTLIKAVVTKPKYSAVKKYKAILVISTLPIFALAMYALKITSIFDPAPFVIGMVLSMVAILIWRKKTYDFRRMAADMVVESIGDGVIALSRHGKILYYNKAAASVFPEFESLRLGASVTGIDDFPANILAEGHDNMEFSLNGNYYESHVETLKDPNGRSQGYVILIIDVTDIKKNIEEMKAAQEKASQANMAKSEFLANMSHEIRTPMNVIIGLSDIIMEESAGRKLYSYAGDIKSASQNLLSIINDILDLSKVEAGKMELVTADYHVRSVVNEVVHMMDIAASQRGILMKCEYDETIPCRYHGDQGRIKQILINLLNNAVKFTREGYVKIYIGGHPSDADGEELLVFKVEDTGCGIREEDQKKIFENFTQLDSSKKRSIEGTGLGLSITKHLVQLMGGSIGLKSVYGEGSTFTVTIPQRIVDARPISEVPDEVVPDDEKVRFFTADGYKVLVVDDNRINRMIADKFLERYGFDLNEAASGPEAIEMVRENLYDMIFMDHMMPGMDGMEAVRKIRSECGENGRSPIIIALTANAMEGVRERFMSNGFQDFLSKPIDRRQLNDMLLKWVPEDRRKAHVHKEDSVKTQDGSTDFDDIRIPGIDTEAARKYQTGSVDDYLEILRIYRIDGKRKIKLIEKLFRQKDYESYEVEVHALKSASANIGALALSEAARSHEKAADGGDGGFIEENFESLISRYQELLDDIGAFLDKSKEEDGTDNEQAVSVDRQTLIRELGEALELLENFRSKECAAIIDRLIKSRQDADISDRLTEIREQLSLYEDTAAEELLRKILEDIKVEE